MAVLDVDDQVPAPAGVEAEDRVAVALAEGVFELVAVAPLLLGGDDRLQLEAVEVADPLQRLGDLFALDRQLALVGEPLPGGAGAGLAAVAAAVGDAVGAGRQQLDRARLAEALLRFRDLDPDAVATEFAGLSGSEKVFDLFCGIGTIGLTMAASAGEVWGVEIVPEAIADAERNAKLNGIDNAHFLAANVRTGVRPLLVQAGKPDVVVIDPPRAGLSQKMIRRVIECEAKRIVYVSCNPTTLAPNAAQLVEAGYTLKRVRPVDMFPQTPHIECVALLEKV